MEAIKSKVLNDDLRCESNVVVSIGSPKSANDITRKLNSIAKVVSPVAVRRRGRPVTNRKVSKVDQIVNRLKARGKKKSKANVILFLLIHMFLYSCTFYKVNETS